MAHHRPNIGGVRIVKTKDLVQTLKGMRKGYYSFADLSKMYDGSPEELRVALHRLVKQERLVRVMKGYYSLSPDIDWEQFACEIVRPSYISLEYALWHHGMLDQVPTRITLVTTKSTREHILTNQVIEYSHIAPNFYFGYKIVGNHLIAEREKAILDEIYLVSLRKRHLSFSGLDLTRLNKRLLKTMMKKFPVQTQRMTAELILNGRS